MRRSLLGKNCKECSSQCIFAGLATRDESENSGYIREIIFKKGETIFKQGTFSSKVIYLQEGLVKLLIEGTGNKDLVVKFFGRNNYLGLNQLFGDNESRYTAITLKNTRVCMIEINCFKKIALSDSLLTERLFQLLTFENDYLREFLRVIGTKNLHGRLAHVLLYLAKEDVLKEDIYNYITRKELADLSVMSVESLERLLGELKRDGIININGKQIEIMNYKLMRALSWAG